MQHGRTAFRKNPTLIIHQGIANEILIHLLEVGRDSTIILSIAEKYFSSMIF